MTPTLIAVAVVEYEGRFLIGQRSESFVLGGLWEFPGGKVEPGETSEEAALRECSEETGLAVEIAGEYPSQVHRYDHGAVELRFFACRPREPLQAPRSPFRWVARDELGKYEFPAGNRQLLKILLAEESADHP
jgi:8-oxo-dGTP diphosphatase